MADNSSSSSLSSSSSSSSGEVESRFALLEGIEAEILEVTAVGQDYTLGDRSVRRAALVQLMQARKMLKGEIARQQGNRPIVARARFTGVME